MTRDASAWIRLGRALRQAREHRGWTQEDLAERSGVSRKSIQSAEGGTQPRARTPQSIPRIAAALGWPMGSIDAVLDGGEPPGGWRDINAGPLDSERLAAVLTHALIRATDSITAAEIRAVTAAAIEELQREGLIPKDDRAEKSSNEAKP